nr:uncharacterized protein LOC102396296 [Bubalus bubalis]
MAEVRRSGTRNCGSRVFVSRRDGCLGPRPSAMVAGAGRGLRAFRIHLHRAADRRPGAASRATSRRARTREAPAPPACAGRQGLSSARPERPERRGASAGAPAQTQARGAERLGAGGPAAGPARPGPLGWKGFPGRWRDRRGPVEAPVSAAALAPRSSGAGGAWRSLPDHRATGGRTAGARTLRPPGCPEPTPALGPGPAWMPCHPLVIGTPTPQS